MLRKIKRQNFYNDSIIFFEAVLCFERNENINIPGCYAKAFTKKINPRKFCYMKYTFMEYQRTFQKPE